MSIQAGQNIASADVLRGLTASGFIRFDELLEATNKTILAGVLLPTSNMCFISPESGGADDLDTITATSPLVIDGGSLLLLGVFGSASVEITLKHNTGNIYCPDGRDVVLRETTEGLRNSLALLSYQGAKWHVITHGGQTPEQSLFNFYHFN